jgi:hypothetical protein
MEGINRDLIMVLSQKFPGETKENHENPYSG